MPDLPLTLIQFLAFLSLSGLLLSIGLTLSANSILDALKQCRLWPVLITNFLLIPALAAGLIRVMETDATTSKALLLLAASPFAPVVPLFVRMSRSEISLSVALTGVMPAFSSVLTPAALSLGLWLSGSSTAFETSSLDILMILFTTITLPLMCGLLLNRWKPSVARTLHRPIEWLAELAGVLSLIALFWREQSALSMLPKTALIAAALLSEAGFVVGFVLGRRLPSTRITLAFGTANRNIGLSLFLALTAFSESSLLTPLLGQSLILIALGLCHVAIARMFSDPLRDR